MINAAIVGLGWWGKTLVEAVSGVSHDIKFVAATTRSLSDEAKAFCKEHDMELRESFEDIIADPNIDAVVLVTPNSVHAAQTIAAAEAGKHVFCEKPFALTGADARAAAEACEKAGVTMAVGYNRRFHPEITKLREMIKSGAHRIAPKEIEEALAEHPQLDEVAVVGIPDEMLGESIHEDDGIVPAHDHTL